MARFEGVKWAPRQMRYSLTEKQFEIVEGDSRIFGVSRSVHYGLFLVFEGIRFYCHRNASGEVEVVFLNWHRNLERFRNGIAFNLSREQQEWVPTADELENVFIHLFLKDPLLRGFLEEMAGMEAQGYLRPFTVDEEQSIGVTFPAQPAVRAMACRYDRYLGEPFCGVVVPNLVRAVGINKTGCLKLGVNYLMSVKAVDEARKFCPEAACALFLDDNPRGRLEDRHVTEWDSSCCLFALRNGTVVKIPENPLILPSVTIHGIVAILREMGIVVEERPLTYGELVDEAKSGELVVAASVGTAGILNRCARLILADDKGQVIATHSPEVKHPLFQKLGEARERYWNIYKEKVPLPAGLRLFKYIL
ncbi:MAG: Branched-chain amino acid aminotransferase/4-amino-4-deoxychorismate lyase-like protein [Candidatus Aminicenantes bacterium]|nr:Branched-chain amino acid aminotransferase/4-amino-4-deoxychorismate lyase-like protein [Candidatus Aminicenantes bacterium]